jgi:hypothetical protein
LLTLINPFFADGRIMFLWIEKGRTPRNLIQSVDIQGPLNARFCHRDNHTKGDYYDYHFENDHD